MRKYYLAAKNGSGYDVETIEEMSEALKKGFSIFERDGETEILIADPDRGWLTEKPEIEGPKICRAVRGDADQALEILLYGKAAS